VGQCPPARRRDRRGVRRDELGAESFELGDVLDPLAEGQGECAGGVDRAAPADADDDVGAGGTQRVQARLEAGVRDVRTDPVEDLNQLVTKMV
jgi:hypothetical protein